MSLSVVSTSRNADFQASRVVALAIFAAALVVSAPAAAQQSVKPSPEAAAIKELQKKLAERDEFILDLLDRVQRLERRVGIERPIPARRVNAALSVSPNGLPAAEERQPSTQQAQRAGAQSAPSSAPPQAAPGQFEVSEEDAQRALERALVQTSASLLPSGKFELVPSLGYQFDQVSHPSQLALTSAGTVLITESVARTQQADASVLFRAGLPWELQAEIGFPYLYKDFSTASRVLGSNLSDQGISEHGYGDPTFTLTKQVTHEGDWLPGLFVSGTWDSDFGQTKNGIALGSGFNEFRFGLNAVKRQDPLVFTAGFTYQTALESHNVTPGDQYTPAFGLLFAVSPETSLRFAQQLTLVRRIKVGGSLIPGTDQTEGIFTFGLLSILGRGLVIDFSTSIGETPDAPDVAFRLGFPIRLN